MSKRLSKRGSVKKALPLPTGRGRVHEWIEKWAALTEADREQVIYTVQIHGNIFYKSSSFPLLFFFCDMRERGRAPYNHLQTNYHTCDAVTPGGRVSFF